MSVYITVKHRDSYIDFLRALGLILLIGVHVDAPDWYKPMRSFDVPLMVFISAMCYKPLRGGILAYAVKRFKRIYIPVAVFLTIFFLALFCYSIMLHKPMISASTVFGSYMLFNAPSIGYVWIMRVFLMIALILPALDRILRNANFVVVCTIVLGIVLSQQFLITIVDSIDNSIIKFFADETVLYAYGYSALAIGGLKIKSFSKREVHLFVIICGLLIIGFVGLHDWQFMPQVYKYPPRSLYLLYGVFASTMLWMLRPLLGPIMKGRFIAFLSEQSMWIYLWHIIPVYIQTAIVWPINTWLLRYIIVMIFSICLCLVYMYIITLLSNCYRCILK